jgi:hypothetical protein
MVTVIITITTKIKAHTCLTLTFILRGGIHSACTTPPSWKTAGRSLLSFDAAIAPTTSSLDWFWFLYVCMHVYIYIYICLVLARRWRHDVIVGLVLLYVCVHTARIIYMHTYMHTYAAMNTHIYTHALGLSVLHALATRTCMRAYMHGTRMHAFMQLVYMHGTRMHVFMHAPAAWRTL